MALDLTPTQRAAAQRRDGAGMAMRIVAEAAKLLGAPRLIPIASAHIDGALYHGDSGTLFAERLVEGGAKVAVRATLNVGALDLTGCSRDRLPPHERAMARRMMDAYRALGCEPSWTCAPYQAGHRPARGTDVAWGESNAVVFCNSVLGARTNRYGDFLDIACAIAGVAPDVGLHRPENRVAGFVFDVSGLNSAFLESEIAWPVLGSLYGREAGSEIGVVVGVTAHPGEDALKAFGAAAASTGAVGLFHIAGVTPEAPDMATALGGGRPRRTVSVTPAMAADAQARLSTAERPDQIDAVAIGSPHLSPREFDELERLLAGRKVAVPFYACTGRHALAEIERRGTLAALQAGGVTVVADTCVVVTPILPDRVSGVLMTNSGKFAQYAPGNTGYAVLYGSMADCVESAMAGRPAFKSENREQRESVAVPPPPTPPHKGEGGVTVAESPSPLRGGVGGGGKVDVLVDGRPGTGPALILDAPISFWGGVDPKSGLIADVRHPQHGESIAGKVLFLPGTIGSSSASAVLLELVRNGHAPAAIVMHEPDAILLLGLIVAKEMGWKTPIAVRLDRRHFSTYRDREAEVGGDARDAAVMLL